MFIKLGDRHRLNQRRLTLKIVDGLEAGEGYVELLDRPFHSRVYIEAVSHVLYVIEVCQHVLV